MGVYNTETIELNNGVKMPLLGYGVFQVSSEICEKCVVDALEVGYRLIDTAQYYGNEVEVGRGVLRSGVPREDIFIVSKIWIDNSGYEKARAAIKRSLVNLKTNYIDLMLIHQPFGDYYGTYRALEEAYKDGLLRAIGVSNFYPDRYIDLVLNNQIVPQVNQNETHVFYQQKQVRDVMKQYDTKLMAWSPFARGHNNFFQTPLLHDLAHKYMKTPAQVALRFLTQEGIIVIPKSSHKDRMIENFNIFDFNIEPVDMVRLRALDFNKPALGIHTDVETAKDLITRKTPIIG